MVSANDIHIKTLYQKVTAEGLGLVFYAFTVIQNVAGESACPEQLRGRLSEAAEALREHLLDQVPNGEGKGQLPLNGAHGVLIEANGGG